MSFVYPYLIIGFAMSLIFVYCSITGKDATMKTIKDRYDAFCQAAGEEPSDKEYAALIIVSSLLAWPIMGYLYLRS